jgi:hypothetical protein
MIRKRFAKINFGHKWLGKEVLKMLICMVKKEGDEGSSGARTLGEGVIQ